MTGRSPLARTPATITRPATGRQPGVTIAERPLGLAIEITARRDREADAAGRMRATFGLELPAVPRHVTAGAGSGAGSHGLAALWSGPGRWLLLAEAEASGKLRAAIAAAVGDIATIVDQSDARLQIGLTGPRVRDALAKLVTIDLHPDVFPVGTAAMTGIAHIPVHLWRLADADGSPRFEFAGPRSYATSLWHHAVAAAEEYGLTAHPLGAGPGAQH